MPLKQQLFLFEPPYPTRAFSLLKVATQIISFTFKKNVRKFPQSKKKRDLEPETSLIGWLK